MSKPIDHDAIARQAKQIMDSFLAQMNTATEQHKFGLVRSQEMREPQAEQPNEAFRRAFFANAPAIKDDLVQMEKKSW